MSATAAGPVLPTDRVSDVLARDESLVEVFVHQAAQFVKLRNPAIRRVMARLITVEDAARMAGLGSAALVEVLNAALGLAPQAEIPDRERGGATAAPRQPAHPPDAPVVEVDVREDLRAGREPFSRIVAAAGALRPGEVLRLRAPFEPVPLYTVLGRRGLAHEARAHGPDDWSVWFWRTDADDAGREPAADPRELPDSGEAPAWSAEEAGPAVLRLDVRGLEPPEPMLQTLAALERLPSGHPLWQINDRVPHFLLPILADRGFVWDIDESAGDHVIVRIRRWGEAAGGHS